MNNPQQWLAKGWALHQAGKLKKAAQCYRSALEINPRHLDALMLLGNAYYELDEFSKAITTLEKVVSLAPENAEAYFNLGLALQAQRKSAEAQRAFESALKLDSTNAGAEYCLGVLLIKQGNTDDGFAHLEKLIDIMPDNPGLFGWLGTALMAQGNFSRAARAFFQAVRLDPDNVEGLIGLSSLPTVCVPVQTAFDCAERVAKVAPDNVFGVASYAWWLERRRRIDEAAVYAKRALKISPKNCNARLVMARVDLEQGKVQPAIERLLGIVADDDLQKNVLCEAYALIGSAFDRIGEYEKAFEAFSNKNINTLLRPESKFLNFDAAPQLLARSRNWLHEGGAQKLEERLSPTPNGSVPIFFIGFPRSGTTLMEQVLGSHPSLQTSGENPALERTFKVINKVAGREIIYPQDLETLSAEQLEELRQVYWKYFENELKASPLERTLIDKNPYNMLHLPLLHTLFPTAKVIMALRDPRDVCLSFMMQNFEVNEVMVHMTDISSIAKFYREVMALWRESRDALSLDWMEYRYEDLIDNFDSTVAHVLDFLGLPWNDDVRNYAETAQGKMISTPSYTGVSTKLSRKAIGRWKLYEKQMAEALAILEPDVLAMGYGDDGER